MTQEQAKQIMTPNEYITWLEVTLASSLSVIESQDNFIKKLYDQMADKERELFNITSDIMNSPYMLKGKWRQV